MSNSSVSTTTKVILAIVVFALIALAWLFACPGTGPDLSSYYPLDPGNSWLYETTQTGKITGGPNESEASKTGTVEQRVVGASHLSSDQLEVVEVSQKVEQPGSETEAAVSAESTLHLSAAPSAITLHAVDSEDPNRPKVTEPVVFLSDPPNTEPETQQTGAVRISVSVKSQAVEPVTVPAGEFPEALKKVVEGSVKGVVSGLEIRSGSMNESTWFVRDVGIVKQVRTVEYGVESPDDGEIRFEETLERVLTEFSTGAAD